MTAAPNILFHRGKRLIPARRKAMRSELAVVTFASTC